MVYKINAENKILGRLATEIADLLRGKKRVDFAPNLVNSDQVIVYNTDKIALTGKKLKQKIYYHHSGYAGGIKAINLKKFLEKDSRQVIREAVLGMLPKNKLQRRFINKLKLYKGEIK